MAFLMDLPDSVRLSRTDIIETSVLEVFNKKFIINLAHF